MRFENRWMIVSSLTTNSPLHIGNGGTIHCPQLINSQTSKPVDINSVCTNKDDRASIPGSTLKGNLRAWAKRTEITIDNFENLFGGDDPEKDGSVGGKVEFYDAVAVGPPHFNEAPPYWNPQRCTGVIAGVAINRLTRTASERKLFHQEFVPPGVSFGFTVTGQNLSDSELEDLLFVLAGFNQGGVTLGAGEEDGWGAVNCEVIDIRLITRVEAENWINSGAPTVGYDALGSLPQPELRAWTNKIKDRRGPLAVTPKLTLDITLEFQSHFLVNDPSRSGTVEEGKTSQAPMIDVKGRLLLPASSFRGAFRSQAEKILRTMRGKLVCCYPDDSGPRAACQAVYGQSELKKLCPVCKVFGAAGWKSPIGITDFVTPEPISKLTENEATKLGHATGKLCIQEFVAIDRFTGSAAVGSANCDEQKDGTMSSPGGKKFNATSVYRPVLSGRIKIDLQALHLAGASRWALGLLALTLRDLVEGDMRFGFAAAKGYGSTLAQVRLAELPPWKDCPTDLTSGVAEESWNTANSITDGVVKEILHAQVDNIAMDLAGPSD
jgi:CRISPR/Cas system CSM-associated protein Csm3 (group 7 of RAMP superfamily)